MSVIVIMHDEGGWESYWHFKGFISKMQFEMMKVEGPNCSQLRELASPMMMCVMVVGGISIFTVKKTAELNFNLEFDSVEKCSVSYKPVLSQIEVP